MPRILDKTGKLDILHANAGLYVGGDLVDADNTAIDRMLNLNVNVVMKNVHDALPHMIERGTGDIIVTSSLAAHFPTPWEPVYASSKWAINCFVQTVRRQVFKHGIRVGSISPGPVITSLLADWPPEKLKEARESGSLLEASEVANVMTVHADPAARHDDPRRRDDADQFRSLGLRSATRAGDHSAALPPLTIPVRSDAQASHLEFRMLPDGPEAGVFMARPAHGFRRRSDRRDNVANAFKIPALPFLFLARRGPDL